MELEINQAFMEIFIDIPSKLMYDVNIPANLEFMRGEKMKFREMRKRAGLRQSDVAERLGISDSSVSIWETGGALPRASLLPDIARLYGCTIEELLGSNDVAVSVAVANAE